MGVGRVEEKYGVGVRWTPFPLHPETPPGGLSLEELFRGRIDVPAMLKRLHAVAAELDLPFGDRTHTYNSRNAQELGLWAEQEGRGGPYRAAVFHAYFAEGRNIGAAEELQRIANGVGLDPGTALSVLGTKRFAGAVDAAWARARRLGVGAVPTHRWRGRWLVGYRPSAELEAFVAAPG